MKTLSKRNIIVLLGLFLFIVTCLSIPSIHGIKNKEAKKITKENTTIEKLNKTILKQNVTLEFRQKEIDTLNKKNQEYETLIKDQRKSYQKKVEQLEKMNKKEIATYIEKDSNGDSLTLAKHLEERIGLLAENQIIIDQSKILKRKSIVQDSIINSQHHIILNQDIIVQSYQTKEEIYKSEINRLNKKIRRQKVIMKVITTGVIVGLFVITL